jgi:hypothetical protein
MTLFSDEEWSEIVSLVYEAHGDPDSNPPIGAWRAGIAAWLEKQFVPTNYTAREVFMMLRTLTQANDRLRTTVFQPED